MIDDTLTKETESWSQLLVEYMSTDDFKERGDIIRRMDIVEKNREQVLEHSKILVEYSKKTLLRSKQIFNPEWLRF